MYEAVSWLVEIFSAMFQGYCLQYFCGSFLESRMRNRRINGLAVAVLYGALRMGAGILLPKSYGGFATFIRLAVVLCILSAIVMNFYTITGKIVIFLVVRSCKKINETDINPPAELGRLADASSDKWSTSTALLK